MRRCVLHVEVIFLVLAMVVQTRHRLNALMQRPAEYHVHFLEASAHREYWYAGGDCGAHQRQGRRVACGVVQRARCAGRAAVALRFDVRVAAGKEQAIYGRQHIFDALTFTECGQQHGERLRAVDDCSNVLFADRVRRVNSHHRAVRADTD